MVKGMLTIRSRGSLAAGLAVIVLLAGCSGGGSEQSGSEGSGESGSSEGSPSAAPSNYLDVGKELVLTPQGSELEIGQRAAVAWPLRKGVAVLDVKVTKVEQVPISRLSAWVLDKKTRSATPYYVHARVANIGKRDLSQLSVPLFVAVGKNTLVSASSFESRYKPCPSTPLPEKFKPGKKAAGCWVYLAPDHGKLENVSFFTGPGFDPVIWSGEVIVVKDKKKPAGKKGEKADGAN